MKTLPIKDIKKNPNNPRKIAPKQLERLTDSIKEFPEMLAKRPIVVDENLVVLGGNMRLEACKRAGLEEVSVLIADDWTEEQKKEFVIKDNVNFGFWDFDGTDGWEDLELAKWGLEENIGSIEVEGLEEEVEDLDQTYEPAKELHIQQEYLLVVFESKEQYEDAIAQLNLQTVKTENHEKDDLNETGIERVITWERMQQIQS